MKKLFVLALLIAATFTQTFSQANAYWYGRLKSKLTQVPITEAENYMFPSTDNQEKNYDNDTINVVPTQYETHVDLDSISATSYVIVAPTSAVLAGAKIYLHAESDGLGAWTVYVKQSTTVIDTLIVGDIKTNAMYIHNGTTFVRAQSTSFPYYVADVTQASSITTGVTADGDAGTITTVSSTIAADDSSASFTFTNKFIKAGSPIFLQCGTTGNGTPEATITSQTGGSAVVKLWNQHRQAALNAVVKIRYLILNR